MRHSYHFLVEVLLIFLLAILFFQHRNMKKERDAMEARLKRLNLELKLRSGARPGTSGEQKYINQLSDSLFDKTDIDYFRKRGLTNPKQAILNSLYRQQQDLIPEKGVLGGRMRIWHAALLSRNWAMAYFEDGHVAGNMLLEYTVKDGNIDWKLIESSLNGQ